MSSTSNSNLVFTPPPLGMRNPAWKPESSPDIPERIVRSAQLGATCWVWVLDVLRDLQVRSNLPQERSARRFQKIALERTNAIDLHATPLPDLEKSRDLIPMLQSIVRAHIKKAQERPFLQELGRVPKTKFLAFVASQFLQQTEHPTLYQYVCFLSKNGFTEERQIAINLEFLQKLEIDPQELIHLVRRRDPSYYERILEGKSFSELSSAKQLLFLDIGVRLLHIERYGLRISGWNPRQPVTQFMAELKKYGPLFIQGQFGLGHYAVPPTKLNRALQGREIYGWKKTDPVVPREIGHAILVIGAEILGEKSYVYFIDPNCDSDPRNPEKQTVFVMSYERLTSKDNLLDLHGFVSLNSPPSVGYAVSQTTPVNEDTVSLTGAHLDSAAASPHR